MKRVVKYALPLVALTAVGFDDDIATADIFLKIDDVKGESQNPQHLEEINVLAWSWGVSNPVDTVLGSAGVGGTPTVSDIKIIKGFDLASTRFFLAVAQGHKYNEAIISVDRRGPAGPEEYLVITLTDVFISKIAHGGKDSEENVSESVTLDFGKIEFKYQQFDASGDAVGAPIKVGYDVVTGEEN